MRTNGPLQLFPLLRVAAFMALGVFAGHETGGGVPSEGWLGLLVLSLAAALVVRKQALTQGMLICLTVFCLGGFLVRREEAKLLRPLPRGDVTYRAVVASQPVERGKVVRMDLWTLEGEGMPRKVKAAILKDTLTNRHASLNVGDGIIAISRMQPPENYYHSNFSYPLYLRCHGFTATTLVMPDDWRKAALSLQRLSYLDRTILAAMRFRQATLRHYLTLGLDDEEMAVAVAMALGDKSRLTNDLRDVYSVSGASHVLALSGLHLGIIYVLLSLLVGLGRRGVLHEMVVILGIWCYAVFTGLSPSVVRAAVMLTIYAATGLLRRDRMSLNALALTAIVMMAVNPLCLYDVGFQMSFMAVLAILVYYKPTYHLVPVEFLQRHRVVKWAWALVVVSCCAQLGTVPLTAYYFGRFSVYFLLTNFFVVPLATLVLYLTAAMLVSALVPALLPWTAKALSAVVGLQTTLVKWVSGLPGASVEGLATSRLQLFLVYVAIAALSFVAWRFVRSRSR
ncbi:MAG: ComEC/Rec2 family competence protein [Prevotella sp.]|nr:ComEC/Rec2 family competence protein [Prevotella sp.]